VTQLNLHLTGTISLTHESSEPLRAYHHIGIPTDIPREGEIYLEGFKADCPLPELVKTVPHVAFAVDDLEAELAGKEILIQPNSPSEGVTVAFIVENGAPIEFLQFNRHEKKS
jgi:hypothetical protein